MSTTTALLYFICSAIQFLIAYSPRRYTDSIHLRVEERLALYHTHVDDLLDPPSNAGAVKAVKDSQHRLGCGWDHTDQRALSR